jgi:hypothetical protein
VPSAYLQIGCSARMQPNRLGEFRTIILPVKMKSGEPFSYLVTISSDVHLTEITAILRGSS